jgi:DUSP domain
LNIRSMSVPYSRQTVRLSFTKRNDDDKPLQNHLQIGKCSSRVSDDKKSISASKSTDSAPQEIAVQPHAAKQRADVALLMRDLTNFTDGKGGLNLKRCSTAGEDGVIVFLIERNWWDTWMTHDEPVPGCGIPRINNWSLVEEQDEESSSGPSLSPIRSHSSGMNGAEHGMSDKHYTDRYHLRRGLSESDFKIVTFEVWTTLTAWYGGAPPLPALLATRNKSNDNGESSSKLNGKRNEVNGRCDHKEYNDDYSMRCSQDESSGNHKEGGADCKDNGLSRSQSQGEYIIIGEDLWPKKPFSVGDVLELEFSSSSSAFSTSNITPAPSYCATESLAAIGRMDGLSGQGHGTVPCLIQSLKSQSPAFSSSAVASASTSTSATESLSSDNLSPSSSSSSVSLSACVSALPSRSASATANATATDCGDYLSDIAIDAEGEAGTGKS